MYILGLDIGSSSVKASLLCEKTGECVASDFFPKQEMKIEAKKSGWAEQDPMQWWSNMTLAVKSILSQTSANGDDISAIGISYQMHGLVTVDSNGELLRPSIIWCDSRAVPYGEAAFKALGEQFCLEHMLNSPGNFTASKLKWIKENEPAIFEKIYKIMLPGDWIAYKLSGDITTTVSGLSEGMFWDFKTNSLSKELMEYYGFDSSLIADIVPTFGVQCKVNAKASKELGLKEGTPISYRAGDQPNNALSLGVLNPGEIASTAGTSGVVYGVNGKINYDPLSRVNTFAHVNHTAENPRLGVLLCINGTGILNSWVAHNITPELSYPQINELAATAPIGSAGVQIIPFGNGAERVLQNKEIGASISNLNFNIHTRAHVARAAQEGIVYSFAYGMEIMQNMGMELKSIKAGKANMFLSPIFRDTLAAVSGATIELYGTDGSVGAARGAAVGAGIYSSFEQAFSTLKRVETIEPNNASIQQHRDSYEAWKVKLSETIK